MIKFVEGTGSVLVDCPKCCYKSRRTESNCPKFTEQCENGYFVNRQKRKSRDRRLLEALLECMTVNTCDGYVQSNNASGRIMVSKREAKQLIAIKEAMRKGTK